MRVQADPHATQLRIQSREECVTSPPVDHLHGGRCGRCETRYGSRGQSGPVRIEAGPGQPLPGVCLWLTRSEAPELKDALNDLLPEQSASSPLTDRRIQAVVATMGESGSNSRRFMAWAGVIPPSVLRGRALSSVATSSSR
jgi:hypothetical protein